MPFVASRQFSQRRRSSHEELVRRECRRTRGASMVDAADPVTLVLEEFTRWLPMKPPAPVTSVRTWKP